jgi:hypothetical protein
VQVDGACWGEGEGVDPQAEFGGEGEEAGGFLWFLWFLWSVHCEFFFLVLVIESLLLFPWFECCLGVGVLFDVGSTF